MYVRRVRLENIREFSGARTVDLSFPTQGSWTVLAGRNGSGKTTLLQAIALGVSGLSAAHSLMPELNIWPGARAEPGSVEVTVSRDHSADALIGPGRPVKGDYLLGLRWPEAANSSGEEPLQHVKTISVGHQSPERGPWAERPRGWLCAGYGPFRRLLGGSVEVQRLMLATGPVGRMATLFHEDASLAEGVTWLVNLHLRRLEQRPRAAETLDSVLDLLSDGLLPDGHRVGRVDSDGLWVTRPGDGNPYPLRAMSDGYRAVAALVLDIVRQVEASYRGLATAASRTGGIAFTAPGVVLIDEVDAHLHVTWQRVIGEWLRQHFPNIQFIVSSHSPYICQAADPGGLIRLPGPDEQRPPEVVDEALYRRIVYGTGDDAALSELFGLETPYSGRAERKRQRLVELERKLYAGTAQQAEIAEYQELAALLSSSLGTRVAEVAARLGADR